MTESVREVLEEMRNHGDGYVGEPVQTVDLIKWADRIEAAMAREQAPERTLLNQCDRILVNVNDYFVPAADAAWLENDRVDEIGITVKLVAEFGPDAIYAVVAAKHDYKGHWRREDSVQYKAALEKARAMIEKERNDA